MSTTKEKSVSIRLRPCRKTLDTMTEAEIDAWWGGDGAAVLTFKDFPLPDGRVVDIAIGEQGPNAGEWVPVHLVDKVAHNVTRMEMHAWDVMSICAMRGCKKCKAALDVPEGTRLIWSHE